MRPLRLTLLLGTAWAVVAAPAAFANPAAYGQQLCVMLASGISQQKAWDYLAADHRRAALAQPPLWIPVQSAASAGFAAGVALGQLEQAQQQFAAMKPDVLKVARATCPQRFR